MSNNKWKCPICSTNLIVIFDYENYPDKIIKCTNCNYKRNCSLEDIYELSDPKHRFDRKELSPMSETIPNEQK